MGRFWMASAMAIVLCGGPAVAQDEGGMESEEPVAVEALPQAVRDAIQRYYPGATIEEAVREIENGQVHYEVEVEFGNRELEVELTADGEVIEVEVDGDDAGEDDGDDDEDDGDDDSDGDAGEGTIRRQ